MPTAMRVFAAAFATLLFSSPTPTEARWDLTGCDACEPSLDLLFVVDSSLTVELTELGGAVGNFAKITTMIDAFTSQVSDTFEALGGANGSPKVEVGGVIYEETVLGYPFAPDGILGSTLSQVSTKNIYLFSGKHRDARMHIQ